MGYFIIAVLGITILFIFPGIVSSIVVIIGYIFNLTSFPIELLSLYVYPVGSIVYFTFYAMFAYLIYEFIHHHLMNK